MPEEPNCGLELSHVTGINEGRCHANRLLRSARKLLESCPGGEKHTSGSGMFITNVLTSLRDRGRRAAGRAILTMDTNLGHITTEAGRTGFLAKDRSLSDEMGRAARCVRCAVLLHGDPRSSD